MSAHDYAILGGYLLAREPMFMFEIGTYYGATSQFVLDLLPSARVVSIATVDRRYNNSDLALDEIGQLVTYRDRYVQLIGDSHALKPEVFITEYGRPDLVFIDGDHSFDGVSQDSHLALAILAKGGAVFWHDAAHPRYTRVATFLQAWQRTVVRESNLAMWSSAL